MARGDSAYTKGPREPLRLAEAQALIESKVRDEMKGPLVAIRFAFGFAAVSLAVAIIALTVAVVT